MSSSPLLSTRAVTAGVARPLIFAFGALLSALFVAAILSGLIIRDLREPIEYASDTASSVAAHLRDIHEAADSLDVFVAETKVSTGSDANEFARSIALGRSQIENGLHNLSSAARNEENFADLHSQRDVLFAQLDEVLTLTSRRWARLKRAEALGNQILRITDDAIEISRDHSARFALDDSAMSRAYSEIRYYLSSMNSFAKATMVERDLEAINLAANRYVISLRSAVSSLAHLPVYGERIDLFDRAQTLFDLGHDSDGYYGTSREAMQLKQELEQARLRYKQVSTGFRNTIKRFSADNDQLTAATLVSARIGLGRYQTMLTFSLILTLLIGTLVIKRYVFDAVVTPLRTLRDATLGMAGGDLETPLDTSGDDEISDLAQALGSFRNVSLERARSEQHLKERTVQLEIANKELDEFAYVASHDLRAPLHGIDSLASFVQEDMEGKLPEESLRHLSLMRARIQRLHTLLDSLLELSRVGRDNAEPSWTQLSSLIMTSATLIDSSEFELIFNVENAEVLLTTTPFEHVVRNLVDNAIKHHDRQSGSVWINASVKGPFVHLEVTDDGPGIPPKFHDRVFGMFQTLQARDKIEGSGMGLAFLKKSVLHYGGSISLHSDPTKARGTTFTVEWPINGQRGVDSAP